MAATIGATGLAQRRYGAPDETGTLTTSQPEPWAEFDAYRADPTDGSVNLVTNVGNLYQCRVDHTASALNEPTGTSDTTEWAYLGAAPGAGNTVAGSLILALHAGRNDPMSTPTDNDSGSFTSIDTFGYADFAQWGMGIFSRDTAANDKSGYAVSATWAGTFEESGAGDEATLWFLEVRGVEVGAPHIHNHVERASPTGGVVAGVEYELTVPCFVLSIWGGIGAVQSPGSRHTAEPRNGLTLIPSLASIVSISGDGYIQQAAAAWTVREPGTYTEEWDSDEGAKVFTLAFPLVDDSVIGTGDGALGDLTGSASGFVLALSTGGGSGFGPAIGPRSL